MGNCQAVDAAALVIQHPSGKIDRLYWPIPATEVMKMNPGHYVSLIIPLPNADQDKADGTKDNTTIRFTRVKLLRPTDTLVLGRAYRLVTTQEVMKVLRAKKHAKTKKTEVDSASEKLQKKLERKSPGSGCKGEATKPETGKSNQGLKDERQRSRTLSTGSAVSRSKSWRPSLQSISESGS